ncbi:NAD+ synthase [bacterium]|nr:NAD+ synthase [bacterium]
MDNMSERIVSWLKEQVEKAGAKGIVFGLSGGIDSACVAVLSKKAFGNNCLGLMMPCESHSDDEEMAFLVANKFSIPVKKISLDEPFRELLKILPSSDNRLSIANVKPRLRMLTLYYFAGNYNYLVAGTDNKTEAMLGYYTKYGDGGVDILPIGNLFKTQVRQLAKELGIPAEIIERKPSAGLWQGQFDEDEIGLSYDEMDTILKAIETNNTGDIDKAKLNKIMGIISKSQHKRDPIPVFRF